jgi:A/G-specific adenine glycosylase
VREAAVLVRRHGRVLLVRWPEGGRWAGLWDFPRFPVHAKSPAALRRELVENVRTLAGVVVSPGKHMTTLTHGVTRFRITLDCYEAAFLSNDETVADRLTTRWLRPADLDRYPLNSTGRKLAMLIGIRHNPRNAVSSRGA